MAVLIYTLNEFYDYKDSKMLAAFSSYEKAVAAAEIYYDEKIEFRKTGENRTEIYTPCDSIPVSFIECCYLDKAP